MGQVLQVEGLGFSYGNRFTLEGISLEVGEGEVLGVIGPNSSGKTTLLRLLSKVLRPCEGSIRLLGLDLTNISRMELARVVAVVPQEGQPAFRLGLRAEAFPFTVLQTVLMGRYPHSQGRFFEGPADLKAAREAMEAVGILHLAEKRLGELSGGERQRAKLARALAQSPRLLLLDEPTAHLDLHHQVEAMRLLQRLHRERGMALVLVSHDLNVVAEACHRLLLLHQGRAVKTGSPEEVIEEKLIQDVYGCPVRVEAGPSGRPHVYPLFPLVDSPDAKGSWWRPQAESSTVPPL